MLGSRWITLDHVGVRAEGVAEREAGAIGGIQAIWIAWERQRRTTELSRTLGIPLFRFLYRGPRVLRYPVLIATTISLLKQRKPELLLVQNPSLVLALICGLLRPLFRYRLVVDRHTNFMLNKPASPRKSVFTFVSDISLRRSDVTIVTNRPLADHVESRGGRAFVLPDRIPELKRTGNVGLPDGVNICFICTYAGDEPFVEVARAALELPDGCRIYVTGRDGNARWPDDLAAAIAASDRIVLTGFLPEEEYENLLLDVDVVMDLTTMDHCLVCGAYEGIAAGKALVLSDKQANRDLFGDHAIYVEPSAESILSGLMTVMRDIEVRRMDIEEFRERFVADWESSFEQLVKLMRRRSGPFTNRSG